MPARPAPTFSVPPSAPPPVLPPPVLAPPLTAPPATSAPLTSAPLRSPSAPAPPWTPDPPPARRDRYDDYHYGDDSDHADYDDRGERRPSRAPLVALALIATIALIGGAVAAVIVFRTNQPAGQNTGSAATPSPLPVDLRLRDDENGSVTLTWTDPSGGTAPFVITGGLSDSPPRLINYVESGTTTYTVHATNTRFDYCFLVGAIYAGEHTVLSELVCTQRAKPPSTDTPTRSASTKPAPSAGRER